MIICEIMVSRVLPVIRRIAAVRLARRMKQKDIAAELGITEAAVSQYLAKRRGSHGAFVEKMVEKSIEKFIDKRMSYAEKICTICRDLRSTGSLCAIHVKRNPSFDARGCRICYSVC